MVSGSTIPFDDIGKHDAAAEQKRVLSTKPAHVFFLQHGLWGQAVNLGFLQGLLDDIKVGRESGDEVLVVNSLVNEANLTYEGIDMCGDRLYHLIRETVSDLQRQGRTVRLSLIGYSMGGLFTRYAVGRLYAGGFFDEVEPVNFVTIASPHLGSWRPPNTWFIRTFNSCVPAIASRSGHQLMLLDKHAWGKPLLGLMSHPDLPFHRALRCFRKRVLMASIRFDRSVPYCTASIQIDNPFEKSLHRTWPADPKYPSVVQLQPEDVKVLQQDLESGGGTAAAATAGAVDGTAGAAGRTKAAVTKAPGGLGGSKLGKPVSQRSVSGLWMPFVFTLLSPIMVPVLFRMAYKGRQHFAELERIHPFDYRWLEQGGEPGSSKRKKIGGSCDERDGTTTSAGEAVRLAGVAADSAAESARRAAEVAEATRALVNGGPVEQFTKNVITQQPQEAATLEDAEDERSGGAGGGGATVPPVPTTARQQAAAVAADVQASTLAAAVARGEEDGQSPASARKKREEERAAREGGEAAAAVPSIDVLDVEVSMANERFTERDGIVQFPQDMHNLQAWMVESMNTLEWLRADVDCSHFHGHAAIVLRSPQRFKKNADVMHWLIDNLDM